MKFSGKNVLVTGATSGVGREAAKLFSRHGAAVIVTGRDETRGHAVVEELAIASAPARFIAADLNVSDDVRGLIQEAGDVDILVNNAGFWELAPTAEATEAGLDAMFAVNVKAPFLLTAAYAPVMAGNGGGAIVNVSTMVADRGQAGMAGYGAAAIVGPDRILKAPGGQNSAAPLLAFDLGGVVLLGIISAIAFATILAVVAGLTITASKGGQPIATKQVDVSASGSMAM